MKSYLWKVDREKLNKTNLASYSNFIRQNYNRKKFSNKKFVKPYRFKKKYNYKSKKIKSDFAAKKFANY